MKEEKTIEKILEQFRDEIYGKDDALFDKESNNVSRQVENFLYQALSQQKQEIAEEIETKLIKQWKNNCSQTPEELLEELGKILNNL